MNKKLCLVIVVPIVHFGFIGLYTAYRRFFGAEWVDANPIMYPEATCLDGTQGGAWLRKPPGKRDPTGLLIFLEGGGWCVPDDAYEDKHMREDEKDFLLSPQSCSNDRCSKRAKTWCGSSKPTGSGEYWKFGPGFLNIAPMFSFLWSELTEKDQNYLMPGSHNFAHYAKVAVHYCDGQSFSGARGRDILDAAVEDAIRKFGHADKYDLILKAEKFQTVVLTGHSAGGLAVILQADRLREKYFSKAQFMAVPVSGYFSDWPQQGSSSNGPFAEGMKAAFSEVEPPWPECKDAFSKDGEDESWRCFLAENALRYIQTRTFLLQSTVDSWALGKLLFRAPFVWEPGQFNPLYLAGPRRLYRTADQVEAAVRQAQKATEGSLQSLENPHVSFYLSRCLDHMEEFWKLDEASVPGAAAQFNLWVALNGTEQSRHVDQGQPKQCACGVNWQSFRCLFGSGPAKTPEVHISAGRAAPAPAHELSSEPEAQGSEL